MQKTKITSYLYEHLCIYLTNYQLSCVYRTDTRDRSPLRQGESNPMTLGSVTLQGEDGALVLRQAGRMLRLQKEQLTKILAEDAEVYVNAEMADEDKVVDYQLELPRNFLLTISDMSQVLTLRRFIVNQLGEKLTVQKKIIAVGLKDVPAMLKFIAKIMN